MKRVREYHLGPKSSMLQKLRIVIFCNNEAEKYELIERKMAVTLNID